jgi:Putative Flp pilus-assembly TadE/G-like
MNPALNAHRTRCASARGAITIFVALALMALLAISVFVIDYGTMWVSRRQAQNAADAAAMAGARSLPINGGSNAQATAAALAFAAQSAIWGQYPAATDVEVSPLPFACPASAAGGGNACIRVDVIRGTVDREGTAHANTLPVFFGSLIGLTSQGVRATATAQAAQGNGVSCMRPWLVADSWLPTPPPWTQNSTFNPVAPPPLPGFDQYIPPSLATTTGFTVAETGLQLVLKPGVIGIWSAGWTGEIDLGTPTTAEQISGCPSYVPTIGLYNPSVGACANVGDATDPARGCVQIDPGLSAVTTTGVSDLVALDAGASWDAGTMTVVGSSSAMSPRIVPLGIFNTLAYYNESCGGPGCVAQIVNIAGFFVEGMCTGVSLDAGVTCPDPSLDVVGRLMNYPGQILTGAGSVTSAASFLTVTRLVQ